MDENKEINETEDTVPEEAELGKKKEKKKKKKMNKALKVILIILLVILLLIGAAVAAFFILRSVGKSHFHPAVMGVDNIKTVDNALAYDEGKTIKYNGKTYKYNEDVIYLAFLGVDKESLDPIEGVSHSAGQCDMNMLVAVNTKTGKVSLILVPRDTNVDVDIYNDDGTKAGMNKLQLCLAYGFGDGREQSCQNVLMSLRRIFFGIDIDNYYAIDLRGISALNDSVGGIEVRCLETIGSFVEGETTVLHGKKAQEYVQKRNTAIDGSDDLRRKRQIQYAKAFAAKAFDAVKSDFGKVTELYDTAAEYSYTNFEISRVTYVASVLVDLRSELAIKDEDIHMLYGEVSKVGGFRRIDLDQTQVFETILDVFYTEAK